MVVKNVVCQGCHEPIWPASIPETSMLGWRGEGGFFCDPEAIWVVLHVPFADYRTQPVLDSAWCLTCGISFGQGHTDWAHEPNWVED